MTSTSVKPEWRAKFEARAKELGIWMMDVPEEYGGLGMGLMASVIVWQELAMYKVPALSVALELDIFESLDAQPDTPDGLAARRDFDARGLRALLPMLMQLGFLARHDGLYQLTEAGRQYMLHLEPISMSCTPGSCATSEMLSRCMCT